MPGRVACLTNRADMSPENIVIAGAGLAGATAARTLRAEGFPGDITIAGAETHHPYIRPPLSKEYLLGKAGEDAVEVVPEAWYAENNVTLRLGVPVTEVDPAGHTVRYADGTSEAYGALLLATGASPRPLQLPGSGLDGVTTFRTLDDSRRLREQLADGGRNVVMIGSGWIGMELAAAASSYGNHVTLLGLEEVPLGGRHRAGPGPVLPDAARGQRRAVPAARLGTRNHRPRGQSHGGAHRFGRAAAGGHRGHRRGRGSGHCLGQARPGWSSGTGS